MQTIQGLLKYDPKRRSTAYQALYSPWFKDMPGIEGLKPLKDIQHLPDKRRSMFSGLRSSSFKKEPKDRKQGLSVSLPSHGSNATLAMLLTNVPCPGEQDQQHPTHLFAGFDLPEISPISPFWHET